MVSPEAFNVYLQAMWHEAKGNWNHAHELVQDLENTDAAWIHAYLHRKEGDQWNANYWYRRAGRQMPTKSLDQEWHDLVAHFLGEAKDFQD